MLWQLENIGILYRPACLDRPPDGDPFACALGSPTWRGSHCLCAWIAHLTGIPLPARLDRPPGGHPTACAPGSPTWRGPHCLEALGKREPLFLPFSPGKFVRPAVDVLRKKNIELGPQTDRQPPHTQIRRHITQICTQTNTQTSTGMQTGSADSQSEIQSQKYIDHTTISWYAC